MTVLEALQTTATYIKTWSETKFFKKTDIDSSLSSISENPVQNKVIHNEINDLKQQIGDIDVSEQIETALTTIDHPVDSVNGKTGSVVLTADDIGIYVQAEEPMGAVDGDIWIDTANDPVPTETVDDKIYDHNIDTSAHSDIRSELTTITNKLNSLPTNESLPAVTESDNGKVLMVVDGAWQVVDLNMSIDANGVVSV